MPLKPVIQLSLQGEFIKEWDSVNAAAKGLGRTPGNISNTLTGNKESAYGFKWQYRDLQVKQQRKVKVDPDEGLTRDELDRKYELIPYNKKYIELGLSDPKKWVEFLKWCEAEADKESERIAELIRKGKSGEQQVVQYTMEGEYVATFKSARSAYTETGIQNINLVCKGEIKHAGGYIWKFQENANPQPELGKKFTEKIMKPKKEKTREEIDEEDYYNDIMAEY